MVKLRARCIVVGKNFLYVRNLALKTQNPKNQTIIIVIYSNNIIILIELFPNLQIS